MESKLHNNKEKNNKEMANINIKQSLGLGLGVLTTPGVVAIFWFRSARSLNVVGAQECGLLCDVQGDNEGMNVPKSTAPTTKSTTTTRTKMTSTITIHIALRPLPFH